MKTYSEIMREKQQKRLAEQQSADKHSAEQQSADNASEQSSKPRKKFTPIVFDDSEKNRTKNDNDVKVATTKRKFTPVVFDLSDKKEEETQKSENVKRFKPIVFDETPSSETKTSSSQQQQQEAVLRRSISGGDTGMSRTGISSPIVLYHLYVTVTNVVLNKTCDGGHPMCTCKCLHIQCVR